MTKSDQVRELLSAKPKMTPKAIADALTNRGVKMSASQVSTIKWNLRKSKRKKIKRAKAAPSSYSKMITTLLAAEEFIDKAGGVKHAQKVLAAFSQLKN